MQFPKGDHAVVFYRSNSQKFISWWTAYFKMQLARVGQSPPPLTGRLGGGETPAKYIFSCNLEHFELKFE